MPRLILSKRNGRSIGGSTTLLGAQLITINEAVDRSGTEGGKKKAREPCGLRAKSNSRRLEETEETISPQKARVRFIMAITVIYVVYILRLCFEGALHGFRGGLKDLEGVLAQLPRLSDDMTVVTGECRGTKCRSLLPIRSERPMRCKASRRIGQFSGS